MAYSFPDALEIIGNVVSMLVAPPEQIGATLPKSIAISGASSRVIISRITFDSKATTPSASLWLFLIIILDRL